jgi:uncharacterized membrane protein
MSIWNRSFIPRLFFTKEEEALLTETILRVEKETTGEIRIRVERRCPDDPVEHARTLLQTLGLTATRERTGVLIYMSISDRRLAIYGDEAIHQKFGNEGWQAVCDQLSQRFQKEEFVEGLREAILQVGQVLAKAFPARKDDINELPNEPSYEE